MFTARSDLNLQVKFWLVSDFKGVRHIYLNYMLGEKFVIRFLSSIHAYITDILRNNCKTISRYNIIFVVKKMLNCSRYRPDVAQRVGRGIALLFHDRGTRRG